MRAVYVASDNIFSPLGRNTADNFKQLTLGHSGIKEYRDPIYSPEPFFASLFPQQEPAKTHKEVDEPTRFEKILIASIADALEGSGIDCSNPNTALIIASTKGNINLLDGSHAEGKLIGRISLPGSARRIASHFNFIHPPVVVSNACISGLLGIILGSRLMHSRIYENLVIAGADIISKFIVSGFQSFQALSPEPCRPFDAERKGINLGEGAATLILSTDKKKSKGKIRVCGGSVNNDANHISGPSRTGEELCLAISKAMKEARVGTQDIDFISAHGTATAYNDEMEARAISLAGLEYVPVNSLKGYFGHTLGAAGLIESIISIHSLSEGLVIPTMGFKEAGTSRIVNVCSRLQAGPLQTCLKTASGFGGCNAAVVFSKD